ncbi:hypothetical protein [Streptomyces mirabilis]|uniref:Uncharacterized protein n=1 Tax=Streptomyces mirabilis TaxID=68239 RepID=A0ABU3V502_9ACTN|nr:hypothetical protein [Streptomyces mirabilis]MCX5355536.1 hypothetical protein [Streptomyces mirabilis]MDU9001183.1 hypothetical protein [Streptomyces mirabilis]
MELLVALATGTSSEAGRRAWDGLSALVRRSFWRGQESSNTAAVSSGEGELTRLEQASTDPARDEAAQALSTALAARADVDPDFSADLQQWRDHVRLVRTGDGDVHIKITGGKFYGPTVWARDVDRISFDTPPPPSPGAGTPPQG